LSSFIEMWNKLEIGKIKEQAEAADKQKSVFD
jgi:hypothetical protein